MSNEIEKMVTVSGVIAEVHPDLSETTIDEIVDTYDINVSEAPITITHDPTGRQSAFSWGWVKKVWKDGKRLMGELLLSPELAALSKDGKLKKRSVGIVEKFQQSGKAYLHHLAFLGAELPRIKGMPDLEFSEPWAGGLSVSSIDTDIDLVEMENTRISIGEAMAYAERNRIEVDTFAEKRFDDAIQSGRCSMGDMLAYGEFLKRKSVSPG